jgi:hypothetical protein
MMLRAEVVIDTAQVWHQESICVLERLPFGIKQACNYAVRSGFVLELDLN